MLKERRTWLLTIATVAALAIALAACSGGEDSTGDRQTADLDIDLSGLVITMDRVAYCYGFCPSYTITIREDGSVEYNGVQDVDVKGIRRDEIELDDVRRLVQRFEDMGFLELPEDTGCPVAIIVTTMQLGSRSRSIKHCLARDETIAQLVSIEAYIDEITDSVRWVGTP